MQNNGGCPSCGKVKAMRAVKKYGGRDWPGSLCRFCGHFVPDVQSIYYDLTCADCSKTMTGQKSINYTFDEKTEAENEELLTAEKARADAEQGSLDELARSVDAEQDLEKKAVLARKLGERSALGLHKPKDLKLRPGWDRRHREHLKLYYCHGCHANRRKKNVEFAADGTMTYVRHVILCEICKKPQGVVDIHEDLTVEEQEDRKKQNELVCPGECTETLTKIRKTIREELMKKNLGG